MALVPPSCVRGVRGLGPDSGVSEVEIPVHLSETLKLICILFCFVEICTKLYNEDEFQPFDPSQEPIFPPELIVRHFTFVVS